MVIRVKKEIRFQKMEVFREKVVPLQPKGCENGLRLSNSNKFDCIRLAPSLHRQSNKNARRWKQEQLTYR